MTSDWTPKRLRFSDADRQKERDWQPIPIQYCDGCGAFRSTPENPRISSWRYFDSAVRKDWLATKDPVGEGIAKALVEVQGMLDRGEL